MRERLASWAKALKRDVVAVWIAARSPRTPIAAKVVAIAVAGYALSPIDLIPDFIPVLGYLDDIIIVPLGIALVIRMIPPAMMADFRAEAISIERPTNRYVAAFIVGLWICVLGAAVAWVWQSVR